MSNYWSELTRIRVGRRRAIWGAATAGVGFAALSLVGCGGNGKSSSSSTSQGQSLASAPVDTTAKAKPGGIYKGIRGADLPSLDPLTSSVTAVYNTASYTYPRLWKFTTVKSPNIPEDTVEGDLIESYEYSADKLQINAKLRQGLKWDSRAPTNGREIDAQDVVFSFNKFARLSPGNVNIVYSDASPNAPVQSMVAVDKSTLQIKMKQPSASVLELLAFSLFYVMPRESDGGFDPKGDMRGYGPWLLQDWKPSQAYTWRKNPDYYVKGRPFFDTLEETIIPEYATQLSVFKAGSIWTAPVKQEDLIQMKKDVPELLLQAQYQYARNPAMITFGYEGDSPFKDERMRQAVSLLVDREGVLEFVSNKSKLEAQGLPVPTRYGTVFTGGWEGAWLDPLDEKAFGPNSKFYRRDVAEAKKLIAAAGKNGVETTLHHPGSTTGGTPGFQSAVSIYAENLKEGGINPKVVADSYFDVFFPNILYGYAQNGPGWNGLAMQVFVPSPTVPLSMYIYHHKDGGRFQGASPNGVSNAHLGDPVINSMLEKALVEFDKNKQNAIAHEFTKYAAGKMYWSGVPLSSTTGPWFLGYNMGWPVIGNMGVYRSSASDQSTVKQDTNLWLDDSKPPVRKPA